MSAIDVRHLSHGYQETVALHDLSFAVPVGTIYGLIGPNGAGKTTTLRIIATLLPPRQGEVFVQDLSVRDRPGLIRRHLGYMPDTFGMYGELRVWEYLDFYASCYGLASTGRRQALSDVLEIVNLGEKRESYVQGLSRGLRQRLSLARTLLHDPAVLVLDEPASGLDPRARVELRTLLRDLRDMGKTILLSSHILADLTEICSHVAILERGKLVAEGAIETVLAQARGNRRIIIEFVELDALPADFLPRFPEITVLRTDHERGRFVLRGLVAGNDGDLARLLTQLVTANVPIVAFREEQSDLEEVFLQLTQPVPA